MGIIFRCPVHPGGGCHQGVWFKNPIDGGAVYVNPDPNPKWPTKHWQRTGDTFEALTLSPSVHVHDTDADGNRAGTHWHGHITNGEVSIL